MACPTSYDEVTLDSTVSDYCRWESDDEEETAEWMGERMEALQDVGADVHRVEDNEVAFTVTLRQAFQLMSDHGWTWEPVACFPEAYLASILDDPPAVVGVKDYQHPLARRISQLMDSFDRHQ